MHSTISIDIDAPPDVVFRLAERRDALGSAAAPLRPVAGGRADRRRSRHRRLRGSSRRRPDPRDRPPGHLARPDVVRPCDPAAPVRPCRRRHEGDGRDLADRPERRRHARRHRARLLATTPRVRAVRRPGVHAADRGPDAGHLQGARGSGRRARGHRMPDRREIWITGIGVITAVGTGVDAFRAGLRAGQSGVAPHRPVRPLAVPVPGRGAGRRLRPAGVDAAEDGAPARPVQPVRARRRAAGPGGRRTRARARWRRLARADRDLPGIGARWHRVRGRAAHPVSRSRHQVRGAEPGPGRLRRRRTGQPRDRPRRPRADPLDRQLLRVGCRGARRGAGRPARGSGRCGHRRWLRDPVEPAGVRGVRHHPRAVGGPERGTGPGRPAVRCGSRWLRDGGGGRVPRPRDRGHRSRARRHAVRHAPRVRRDVRRPPHGPATGGRVGGGSSGHDRPRRRRRGPVRDRLRERARVVHPDRRPGRGAGDRSRARGARGDRARQRDEGPLRPSPRRIGRHRGCHLRARRSAMAGRPPR